MSKKVIAIAVAILVFGALVPNLSAQTSLLHEEFESSFPPSGWTITTEAGSNQWYRNDEYGYDKNNYSGGGGFCASNNDDYWYFNYIRNNSVQSPAFDASGYATVWLAFNYTWEDYYGTEHAYVDVFNGSSWIQVKELPNTGYYSGVRDSIDISAHVGDVADAQVRFRYDEDGGSGWAYWYLVDKVDVWAGGGGGVEIDTVVNENFNGGWPFPGWTTSIGSGLNQWSDLNGLGGFWANYAASGGGNCAENDDYWATLYLGYPQCVENALISPAFTLGGNIWLEFDRGTYYMASTREMRLEVWDGSTWQLITSYTSSQLWQHDVWSLSAFGIDGVTDAQVRFVYNETSPGYSYFYQIDNVLIYGETGSSEELDLVMVQIIRPHDEEEGGVPFTPACRILNNLDTATAAVGCRIKDFETRETVYEDVLSFVPLVLGYNVVDGFKDFTPESNKKYTVIFWLEHDDDVNEPNNALDKNWTTFAGTDVTPTVMLSPAPQQYNEFDPEATFEEHAGAELTVATLHCKIEDGEYHAVVYEDSVTGEPFTAEESKNIEFQTVEGLENGTYTITFWATGELSGNISNPPLVETFEYSGIAEAPVAERTSLSVSGTTVNFSLEKASDVSIRIYDITGNLVTTLVSGRRGAGSYTLTWNTTDVASGVYFVKMRTPEFSASGKMVVLY